ncbi:programmed cell death protein [Allomyces javanicus]|nr:programmed cell death protein [Allomyces javanicus]
MYSDSDSDAASDFTQASGADGWTPTGDYLAFPDGKVSRSRAAKDLIDHTVSRLGGPAAPLAPNPPIPTPACAACARPLLLVAQLYAPLDDDEVRVLYVWGCNRRACMPRPGAWFAARGIARRRAAQAAPVVPRKDDEVDLEHEEVVEKVVEPKGIASVDKDLFHVADDVWGSAAKPNSAKPDAAADPFGGFDTPASVDLFGGIDAPNGSDPFGGFGDASSKPASNPFAGFDVPASTAAFDAPIADLKFQLTPKEVAPAKPTKKAVPVPDPAPIAVTAAAAATPDLPTTPAAATTTTTTTDATMSLLDTQLASLSLGRADATVFPAYYLLIEEEFIQSKLAKAAAYAHYQLGDGTLGDGDLVDGADSSSGSAKPTSESYESTTIKGFTRTLEKFVERIEDNPGQVVRYRHGGRALHYSDFAVISAPPAAPKAGKPGAVPKCARCGSARVFECQLMSTLLSVLPVEQYAAKAAGTGPVDEKAHPSTWYSGMEFGTVLVYTCGKNCAVGAEASAAAAGPVVEYTQEVCVVQLESE